MRLVGFLLVCSMIGWAAVGGSVRATATVHLEDGETVVLGGLMPDRSSGPAGTGSNLLVFVTGWFIRPSPVLLQRQLEIYCGHGGSQQGRLE